MDFSSTLRTTLAMVFESKTVKQRLSMYTVIQKFEKNLKKLLFFATTTSFKLINRARYNLRIWGNL